jgi:hypothetical protein
VPFEEDLKNPGIWYLDHNYLESMFYMFKKINGQSRPVSQLPSDGSSAMTVYRTE